jgi:hypothetical protein
MAINFSNIGLQEPSTISNRIGAVTIVRGSTAEQQEILVVGDPESSLGMARVVDSAPNSTHFGLVVRVAQPSTGPFQISSLAGVVSVNFASTASVRVTQSTATDLRAAVSAGSTDAGNFFPVRIVDSSGTGWARLGQDYTDGSTTSTLVAQGLVFNNSTNNTMRVVGITQPLPVQLVKSSPTRNSTTVSVSSSNSTAFYTLISSVAGVSPCVYAYAVTSTVVTPMLLEFISDTSAPKWGLYLGSASSGVTGANLAVSPPGALFQGSAGSAINVRLGSTGVPVQVSVSWFAE